MNKFEIKSRRCLVSMGTVHQPCLVLFCSLPIHHPLLFCNQNHSVGSPLPSYDVTILEDSTTTKLSSLANDKFLVLDFWTSKCVKCPAALDKLDEEAIKYSEVAKFVSVALSQGTGNMDMVKDLVEE